LKNIASMIAQELNVQEKYVENVIQLLDEGNTIPFIARYRKEMHGTMDDTTLRSLFERLNYLRNLQERMEAILSSISEQGKLTEELEQEIREAETLARLEDLYRPYKQKRRTRATIAKEKGLEPLSLFLALQGQGDPKKEAEKYVDAEKGVESVEDALAGALDILAENISDDAAIRDILREFLKSTAIVHGENTKEEDSVYRTYYNFSQPYKKMAGHQVLALNRGEKEGFLKVTIEIDQEKSVGYIKRRVATKTSPAEEYLNLACEDSFTRLIFPSLERELRNDLTDAASEGAIHNFALNLEPLLMQPPVKGKVTMGLDPGYRNGCKVAIVDATGKVMDTTVVYPTFNDRKKEEAIEILSKLIKKDGVEHIAIGNGTASRETESMAAEMIRRIPEKVSYAIVNEAGASVYSASKLAAEEFPDYDVNLRSAVSIARRLQDPLAELVKIEPMAIGVGQYQHDMPQTRLKESLEGVVEDCVNRVGVDVNTASVSLLEQVSGLSKVTAKNIVLYREENGAFKTRNTLKKVPKLGPKAFEQCAGFLRIPESKEVLDNTAVHPESYEATDLILSLLSVDKKSLKEGVQDLPEKVKSYGEEKLAKEANIGLPTLRDIITELKKPGRDVREDLPPVVLRQDVLSMEDLKPGMKLKGTVRNVIDFGAFVDIGVHQDGLVHISEICNKFIKHPSEVLKVGDIVDVSVLSVDLQKHKISLSMKQA